MTVQRDVSHLFAIKMFEDDKTLPPLEWPICRPRASASLDAIAFKTSAESEQCLCGVVSSDLELPKSCVSSDQILYGLE